MHLHVHTEYSLLDGACRIKELCAQAARLGMKSMAVTDHGVMFGVIDFYKEAKRQGVKPIIGCEVYMAARSRHDKAAGQDTKSSHLILLAKNNEGYKNLVKLVSAGFTEGYYYRPRIDFELLERYNVGLIALSACLSGDVPAALAMGDEALASRLALKYKGIFGPDFYLELQDSGFPDQKPVNAGLIRLSRKHEIPLVVTNDVHYILREDARAQDVLMCIQTGKTVDDPDRMQINTSELYLKSADEMAERFPNFPGALSNTARIAEMCEVEFEFGKARLPKFELPGGAAEAAYTTGAGGATATAIGAGGAAEAAGAADTAGAATGATVTTTGAGGAADAADTAGAATIATVTTAGAGGAADATGATGSAGIADTADVADLADSADTADTAGMAGAAGAAAGATAAASTAGAANATAGAFAYLKNLCMQGLNARYGGAATPDITRRLDFELSVIRQMGYVDYFLIVWDFIRYAREKGIPVGPGRGSAAGSLVSYTLYITDVDPIRYNLLFERFLNPERISMPDIDIDFCYERRQEVIDYVIGKYGEDHVAQIITFGTMAARAVIRDVGRALNVPYGEVDRIAKMIPYQIGMTIERALELNAELALLYDENAGYRELIDMAKKLEGMPRHASTHAAGVLITDRPVTDYVPLQRNDECVTTQFPMLQIEELGLLKMDFLGLRTLTVIHDTITAVRETRGIELDMDAIDLNDPGVYKMISDGDTVAVFQLESGGMTQFMKEMQPSGIEDLIAGGALFRPGPMESIPRYVEAKHSRGAVSYADPKLEPILDVTYGCIVYQEQVMQIVRELAGFSFGRADLLRRAMSKKKHDVMENERKTFIFGETDAEGNVLIPGAVRNGVPEEAARRIYDDMSDFASYGFNKSHSAAYALLIYRTAWLKYYYPVEFMAATLNSCMYFSDKVAHYIEQCRLAGIPVLPPDINRSFKKFTVVDKSLRFGLAAVKNIGGGAVEAIIVERRAHGAFQSFTDFLRRVGASALNKRGVESLIRCGAFDSLNLTRSSLIACFERLLDGVVNSRRSAMEGQISFLGEKTANALDGAAPGAAVSLDNGVPRLPEYPQNILLNMEKEILGLYVSGHPLDGYVSIIEDFTSCDTRAFRRAEDGGAEEGAGDGAEDGMGNGGKAGSVDVPRTVTDGQGVIIGGIVAKVKTKYTKSNALMAFIDLEDVYGSIEMLVFPKIYERLEHVLAAERIVLVKGKISSKEDEDAKFLCDDAIEIEPGADQMKLRRWAAAGYGRQTIGGRAANGGGTPYGGGMGVAGANTLTGASTRDAAGAGGGGGESGKPQALYIRIGDRLPGVPVEAGGQELPGGPVASDAPVAPVAPVMPVSPVTIVSPVTAVTPVSPVTPVTAVTPVSPAVPVVPVSPVTHGILDDAAYATFKYFSGHTPVYIYDQRKKAMKELGREYWVKLSDTLLAEMRERFGADNVALR